jgi:hypothetical protein
MTLETKAASAAQFNPLNRHQQNQPAELPQGSEPELSQGPALELAPCSIMELDPQQQQPPSQLQPPDTPRPETQFSQLGDAKPIVLSYLKGGEIIRIFLHPELWDLVKDNPAVHAFLQAAQQHAQFSAAHATAEVNVPAAVGQHRKANWALLGASVTLCTLEQALGRVAFRLGSPEHDEALRKREAAHGEYQAAHKAFETAALQELAAKKAPQTAKAGIDSAHSRMRQHLDEIRWVGSAASMHASGWVIDYSDPKAPLDAAAFRQKQEKDQAR